MTMNATLTAIGSHYRIVYTIEHRGDCVLITGSVPASAFAVLAQLVPEGSVLDPDVARMWGATFAFGLRDDLQELREAGEVVAMQRVRQANPAVSAAAAKWLASGARGISSNTIFTHLTGIDALNGTQQDVPRDPSDFRRCRLLLEQVPELVPLFPKMADVSPQWAALVENWPLICVTMNTEQPNWRNGIARSPQTYDLIKRAISQQ